MLTNARLGLGQLAREFAAILAAAVPVPFMFFLMYELTLRYVGTPTAEI